MLGELSLKCPLKCSSFRKGCSHIWGHPIISWMLVFYFADVNPYHESTFYRFTSHWGLATECQRSILKRLTKDIFFLLPISLKSAVQFSLWRYFNIDSCHATARPCEKRLHVLLPCFTKKRKDTRVSCLSTGNQRSIFSSVVLHHSRQVHAYTDRVGCFCLTGITVYNHYFNKTDSNQLSAKYM